MKHSLTKPGTTLLKRGAFTRNSPMTRQAKLVHFAHREYVRLMLDCGVAVLVYWDAA